MFKTSVRIITIPAPDAPHLKQDMKSQQKNQCVNNVQKWIIVNGYVTL